MKYEGVIFDLDGTLIDSIEIISKSMNKVLKDNSHKLHNIDEYKNFIGDSAYILVKRSLPKKFREDKYIKRITDNFIEVHDYLLKEELKLFDDVPILLDNLKEIGLKLAVFSNKPQDSTDLVNNMFLNNWNFDLVVGESKDIPKKPNPKGALHIADKINIAPEKLIFVGDSGVDMETAKKANMFAVGASWGYRPKVELSNFHANIILDNPLDLIKYI